MKPPLHPDDLLFFHDVAKAMRAVARHYDLPLKSITHLAMPESGMADCLGLCFSSGDIQIAMRATVDGLWVEHPRSPDAVWDTAAHELAHLRHMNHGEAFQAFRLEMVNALANRQEDHREKVLRRLVKMQASRDSEAKIGNNEAAEAFAAAINRMLIENELNPTDIDYARRSDDDPVIELPVNLGSYNIVQKKVRIAWQESLARIVARAHLCSFLLSQGSNKIWFVGTKSHATVAEYTYGILVPAAEKMSIKAKKAYANERFKIDGVWGAANGFREAWLDAFLKRIAERFDEARAAAVADMAPTDAPGATSTALLRLDGQLVKVRQYMDDKFSSRRGAPMLNSMTRASHSVGRERGRAAADAMAIGRKGVTGGRAAGRKLLT